MPIQQIVDRTLSNRLEDCVLSNKNNRRNSASCDETGRITFSFFIHLSFAFAAIHRDSYYVFMTANFKRAKGHTNLVSAREESL